MATVTKDTTAPTRKRSSSDRTAALKARNGAGAYTVGDRLISRKNTQATYVVTGVTADMVTITSDLGGSVWEFPADVIDHRFERAKALDKTSQAAAQPDAEPATSTPSESVASDARPQNVAACEPACEPNSSRVLQMTCSVSRKLTHNYQSTEYHCGATVEITDGSDPAQVAGQTYDLLRDIIRKQFKNGNGKGNDDAGTTAIA